MFKFKKGTLDYIKENWVFHLAFVMCQSCVAIMLWNTSIKSKVAIAEWQFWMVSFTFIILTNALYSEFHFMRRKVDLIEKAAFLMLNLKMASMDQKQVEEAFKVIKDMEFSRLPKKEREKAEKAKEYVKNQEAAEQKGECH